jgi:hypothetical protein
MKFSERKVQEINLWLNKVNLSGGQIEDDVEIMERPSRKYPNFKDSSIHQGSKGILSYTSCFFIPIQLLKVDSII